MSETIKPALTPEQWALVAKGEWISASETELLLAAGDITVVEGGHLSTIDADDRHEAAALCLHGQPFGFTQDDIELLSLVQARLRPHPMADLNDERARLVALADRIAALLPPPSV